MRRVVMRAGNESDGVKQLVLNESVKASLFLPTTSTVPFSNPSSQRVCNKHLTFFNSVCHRLFTTA